MLRKTTVILATFCMALLSACSKDGGSFPYDIQMQGINLRDINASPVGSLGSPDTKTSGQGWSFVVYPVPCNTQINISIQSAPSAGLPAKVKLVSALYQGAPPNANVENINMAGTVVREMETGAQQMYSMNTADLPQGFYRIYFEVSNGETYWDNIWIAH